MQYSQKQIDQNSRFLFHSIRRSTSDDRQNPWRVLHWLMAIEITCLIVAALLVAGDRLQQANTCIPQTALVKL